MVVAVISANEKRALELLIDAGGSLLVSEVPDRNERDVVFCNVKPGHSVYRKLEKMDFVWYTEEEPLNMPGDPMDGFVFTCEIYITDKGREAFASNN